MRKKTIGIFYGVGLFFWIISLIMFIQVLAARPSHLDGGWVMVEIGIGWIGGMLICISLVGALINLAKVGRWGWFIGLFLLSVFALPAYLFAGPGPTSNASRSSSPFE